MFKSVEARYALRCVLVGVAAFLTATLTGAELWPDAIAGGILSALSYAGVGAAVPSVEPQIGKKLGP